MPTREPGEYDADAQCRAPSQPRPSTAASNMKQPKSTWRGVGSDPSVARAMTTARLSAPVEVVL